MKQQKISALCFLPPSFQNIFPPNLENGFVTICCDFSVVFFLMLYSLRMHAVNFCLIFTTAFVLYSIGSAYYPLTNIFFSFSRKGHCNPEMLHCQAPTLILAYGRMETGTLVSGFLVQCPCSLLSVFLTMLGKIAVKKYAISHPYYVSKPNIPL